MKKHKGKNRVVPRDLEADQALAAAATQASIPVDHPVIQRLLGGVVVSVPDTEDTAGTDQGRRFIDRARIERQTHDRLALQVHQDLGHPINDLPNQGHPRLSMWWEDLRAEIRGLAAAVQRVRAGCDTLDAEVQGQDDDVADCTREDTRRIRRALDGTATPDVSRLDHQNPNDPAEWLDARLRWLEDIAHKTASGVNGYHWRVDGVAKCQCCDKVKTENGTVVDVPDNRISEFIAIHDPAGTLRLVAEFRKIMSEHSRIHNACVTCRVKSYRPDEILGIKRSIHYPCPTLVSLATSLGWQSTEYLRPGQ